MTEERSMQYISTRIHGSIPAYGTGAAKDFDITIECSEKTLIGFGEPETEIVSFDNPDDVTGTTYVGKSTLQSGTGTAKGDWETYRKLLEIKRSPVPVLFQIEYLGTETGNRMTCRNVMLGTLGGFSGSIAPQFAISFLAKGGKVADMPVVTLSESAGG